jgi:SAM-dependent methyltransferase
MKEGRKEGRLKALDFGCGIGRQTILLEEFGIEAYGIDISEKAIKMAKELAVYMGFPKLAERLRVYDGLKIPFEDNFFDFTISCGVLDSMHFELAKTLMKEVDRVTKKLAFITLISGDNDRFYREYNGEEIVETEHERGTIQSYYNWSKVLKLIEETSFSIKWARLITEEGINHKFKYGRYYIVLEK